MGRSSVLLMCTRRRSTTDGVPAMVQDAMDDVRTMARALMPNRLADDGLPDALRLLADDVAAASVDSTDGNGTDINVLIDDDADGAARALGRG